MNVFEIPLGARQNVTVNATRPHLPVPRVSRSTVSGMRVRDLLRCVYSVGLLLVCLAAITARTVTHPLDVGFDLRMAALVVLLGGLQGTCAGMSIRYALRNSTTGVSGE